ncbi:tRNA(Phe) (4-demethylwyosine(37)-C(7)) aminocarboxypropyltransferase NDAI_0G00730 [Naumovozyma dairenensis CBS 421]|uniref:tRNA wybutosine-synthesizing protein 2 n=1 Tax=Naumovozyma dairenensis (strain ATCC 10597 / BCRC 20456 / CBS 421 / NBRC 0211 / NRRL Y-12639) TaxID=1071378 RepID=G0WDI8_NAUDC|nr:hypothetical protein NDAI_0G00730 [Naumovozyma dairenensis CBS 421]CCD25849.2 hypothetical protein NDAI_0G00730 [Naumovozyma dairenensis CBS 421]
MVLEITIPNEQIQLIKPIKTALEAHDNFIKPILTHPSSPSCKVIRTNLEDVPTYLSKYIDSNHLQVQRSTLELVSGKKAKNDILKFTKDWFSLYHAINDNTLIDRLIEHTPYRYSKYPPLLLFNNSTVRSFDHDVWKYNVPDDVRGQYFHDLLKYLSNNDNESTYRYIGINKPIIYDDVMRQPKNIKIVYPSDSTDEIWCQLKQNGIWQVWNPLYTMFSRGNIKEKKRILDTFHGSCKDIDVVDLYCGIGYFSFSYLFNGARNVFGFDINPWSIKGLQEGLRLNKFGPTRCHFYNESNEMSIERIQQYRDSECNGEKLLIRHINLGLLPSSRQGWPIALKIIDIHSDLERVPDQRVTLHIHENVHIDQIEDDSFVQDTVIPGLRHLNAKYHYRKVHVEKIKTFAPDIWHVCIDIDVYR